MVTFLVTFSDRFNIATKANFGLKRAYLSVFDRIWELGSSFV
ncbi:hypothetical protein SAMN05192574_102415 [Mucilaginibacter gossypiicola]|uniref:Uncharacterized protein n=1 Tax=Mucilaginibacter gossypiicola TaxID=551995 RepID=A0A1H8DN84_9SPHI|nr:hypothetical protein SAMN05192574_102415 [Mucilaginibacter gossypiicola]